MMKNVRRHPYALVLIAAAALCAPSLMTRGSAQTSGPVVAFSFSEGTGTSVSDYSANNNVGTIENGGTWGVGRFGAGLELDGIDDLVSVPESASLELTAGFTVEAWIKPAAGSWDTVVSRGSSSNAFFRLELDGDRRAVFSGTFSGGYAAIATPIPLIPDRWTHVAVTYDGVSLRLYTDGTVQATTAATGGLLALEGPLQVGGLSGPYRSLQGGLDETRIYSRALSASEVGLDMITPVDAATDFQVAHYTPSANAVGVLTTPISAGFSAAVNVATITTDTVGLFNAAASPVAATVTYSAVTRRVTITPSMPLDALADYTVRVRGGGSGVRDASGAILADDASWTFRTAAASDAPVAAFAFSEGLGAIAHDLSGNGNTGTLIQAPTWTPLGKAGTGLLFQGPPPQAGDDQNIRVPASDTLNLADRFTLMAWIKPSAGAGVIVRRSNDYWLGIDNEAHALKFWGYFNGAYATVAAPVPVSLNGWTHVAVTYDAAASSPRLLLYVDGVLVASNASVTGGLRLSADPVSIGGMPFGWFTFPGVLDEVRIYRTARSAVEIESDMASPIDDVSALEVSSHTPSDGERGVVTPHVTAVFTKAVAASSVNDATFDLSDDAHERVAATITYDSAARRATLTPLYPLTPLARYTATLHGGPSGVTGSAGEVLSADVSWSFYAAANYATAAAAYGFGEQSGVNIADATGNGNVGTLMYAAAWTSEGRSGGGVAFDGVVTQPWEVDAVQVPMSESLSLQDAFTLEGWIRVTGASGAHTLAAQDDSYWFGINAETHGAEFWGYFNGVRVGVQAPTVVPVNTWTHLAVAYDASAPVPRLRLYMNGVLVGSSNGASGSLPSSAAALWLGGVPFRFNELRGALDDVRVYRRALSASEIFEDLTTPVDGSNGPLQVTYATPAAGAIGALAERLSSTFSAPLNPTTVTTAALVLRDANGTLIPSALDYDPATRTVTLTPNAALQPLREYTLTVASGTQGVRDELDRQLDSDVTWSFTTSAAASLPSAAYAFDEGTGTIAFDHSGNGNGAVLVRGAAWTTAGRLGGAVSIDGVVNQPGEDDALRVAASETTAFRDAFSIEAWVNIASATGGHIVATRPGVFSFQISPDTHALEFAATLAGGQTNIQAPAPFPVGTWTHVAVTYDAASAAPRLRLYIDAEQVATNASADGTLVASVEPIWLGGAPFAWRELGGVLDEVRFYRRALSAAEVSADMNAAIEDDTPPAVVSVFPSSGSTGVSPGVRATVTFSESMLASSLTSSTITLKDSAGTAIPVQLAYDDTTRTLTADPLTRLANLSTYTLTIRGVDGVTDVAGNALASSYGSSFTTADAEMTPPTISATVTPLPNAQGWNVSDVTVTFSCDDASGIAHCPDPIHVYAEGAGQVVSGVAIDSYGNRAVAAVTLSIDRTAPSITIADPAPVTTVQQPTIAISGTVHDSVSGIATVSCDNNETSHTADTFSCVVNLLPGSNTVLVETLDAVGNSASASVRVLRYQPSTAIAVSPQSRTVVVGERYPLTVTDQLNEPFTGVSWTSSDESVARVVVEDDRFVVLAGAPGEATLTASAGAFTVETSVTVFAGPVLPPGTEKWRFVGASGAFPVLLANQQDPSSPEQFATGWDTDGTHQLVYALSGDGTLLWSERVPGDSQPAFADPFGGFVTTTYSSGSLVRLRRFGGLTGGPSWSHWVSSETPAWLKPAQGPNGAIYLIEYGDPHYPYLSSSRTAYLVVIDGKTGHTRATFALPSGYECGWGDYLPNHTSPIVGADGAGYVAVVVNKIGCSMPQASGTYTATEASVQVFRIDRNGRLTVYIPRLKSGGELCEYVLCQGESTTIQSVQLFHDGEGGVILSGSEKLITFFPDFNHQYEETMGDFVYDITPSGTFEWSEGRAAPVLVSDDNTLFERDTFYDGDQLVSQLTARDGRTGNVKWSLPISEDESPVEAVDGGGVLLANATTRQVAHVDGGGHRVASETPPGVGPLLHTALDEWSGASYDPATDTTAVVAVQATAFGIRTVAPFASPECDAAAG